MSQTYQEFLRGKTHEGERFGFKPIWMPDFLFDFQKHLVDWAIEKGRGAVLADCGLGKTPMLLTWAENVLRKTNKNVLIFTPLAVAPQMVSEGVKFGVEVHHIRDGKPKKGINVINYDKMHLCDPSQFVGVVGDEISCIKAFDGKLRKQFTAFQRKIPYRFADTATPCPNDSTEIGTISEALGYLGQRDMLTMFFRSTDNLSHVFHKNGDFWNRHKWMFKAHSEIPFYQWVCSWARACRKPSDLGFDDGPFKLPPLNINQHVVDCSVCHPGEMFPRVAITLQEQRHERRVTMDRRCEMVARLVDHNRPVVVWCHLNDEGDALERGIPGAVQVAGANSEEEKEERLAAFAKGEIRVLVTKSLVSGWGLNWQHCGDTTFFPSHSYEQWYQSIRRFWRFGRTAPVNVEIITTPGEEGVTANLKRKAESADKMFDALVREMHNSLNVNKEQNTYDKEPTIPSWL